MTHYFATNTLPKALMVLFTLLLLGVIVYGSNFAARHPVATTPAPSTNDAAWDMAGVKIDADLHQLRAARNASNQSDVVLAAASLREHCHEAEPLQYHPGKPIGQREQSVKDACASYGFPLPAP